MLGSYGVSPINGQFCYKIMHRDKVSLIYFGALTSFCHNCGRWCRVRILPKEKRAEVTQMRARAE